MSSDLVLFGPTHLLILAAVPLSAKFLASLGHGRPSRMRRIRYALASALSATALGWYAYLISLEGVRFPEALPLDLCDLTLWVTVAAAVTLNRTALEFAYFAGVGGSSMALLTPDLWAPLWSVPTIAFLVTHGLVVATPLALIWSGASRPRPGSPRRVLVLANIYATMLALFNAWFGTNYMYLCRKPANPSLLDYFGPWPLYLISGELFAAAVFGLLWLPFRKS